MERRLMVPQREKSSRESAVSDTMRKVLFYFMPAKQGGDVRYRVIAMEDGFSRFPLGHTRLLNLSPGNARFALGEHRKNLKAGAMTTIAPVRKRNAMNMADVRCDLQSKNGNWLNISETKKRFTGTQAPLHC